MAEHGNQVKDGGSSSPQKVYLNYTQDELDKAYTQVAWAPNMKDVLARQSEASAKLRWRWPRGHSATALARMKHSTSSFPGP